MKKIFRKIYNRIRTVKTQQVYCIESNTNQEAQHIYIFGHYIASRYVELEEPKLFV